MKQILHRIIAVGLLFAFLYDTTFRPLDLWLNLQHESTISTATNFNTQENAGIFTFKIPIALPYSTDWQAPIETNGLVEINGVFYTLIDKNISQDTLYIRALQNENARIIFNSLAEHIQKQVDKNSSNNDKNPSTVKTQLKLFHSTVTTFTITNHVSIVSLAIPNFSYQNSYQNNFSTQLFRPPNS